MSVADLCHWSQGRSKEWINVKSVPAGGKPVLYHFPSGTVFPLHTNNNKLGTFSVSCNVMISVFNSKVTPLLVFQFYKVMVSLHNSITACQALLAADGEAQNETWSFVLTFVKV